MPATYQRDFIHQPRVLLVFIEFNILICLQTGRQKRTHLNPAPPPALQPPPQPQPQPPAGEEESHPARVSCPGSSKDKKEDATATSWPTSYTPTSQNFVRMPPGLHHQRTHTTQHQDVSQQFQEAIRS